MPNFTTLNSKVVAAPVRPGAHVVARRGAMLAYEGQVRFYPATAGQNGHGAGSMRGSLGAMAGRAMAGESAPLMVADGNGEVLYGHAGLHVHVVDLDGSAPLTAEADRLLVHDSSLQSSVVFLGSQGGVRGAVRGAVTGQGLFTTQLHGIGSLALLSHGDLLELPVNGTLGVDPQAYVAHTGNLQLEVTTLGAGSMFRDAVGHGSGESIQLKVSGNGTVFVQTSERKF